jgi:hypothetical protein
MPDLVDQLIGKPGRYLGTQHDPKGEHPNENSVAHIVVTALPGGAGVAFDYDVVAPDGLHHTEHTVLGRTTKGLALITAHSHAGVVTVIPETEPGYFVAGEDDSPFPMAIRIEVPEPGHIVYSWSYGMPGDELTVRDIGDVKLVSQPQICPLWSLRRAQHAPSDHSGHGVGVSGR